MTGYKQLDFAAAVVRCAKARIHWQQPQIHDPGLLRVLPPPLRSVQDVGLESNAFDQVNDFSDLAEDCALLA